MGRRTLPCDERTGEGPSLPSSLSLSVERELLAVLTLELNGSMRSSSLKHELGGGTDGT